MKNPKTHLPPPETGDIVSMRVKSESDVTPKQVKRKESPARTNSVGTRSGTQLGTLDRSSGPRVPRREFPKRALFIRNVRHCDGSTREEGEQDRKNVDRENHNQP